MPVEKVPSVVVLGSINMDVMIRCKHLPSPGETVIAESSVNIPGGKGANQAVAAARLGAEVSMIGRLGNDLAATELLESLQKSGVNTAAVFSSSDCDNQTKIASGLAVVMVDQAGENSIVVVPGTNGTLSKQDVDRAADVIKNSDILLVQLEIPIETVMHACQLARDTGVRVILDPAPAPTHIPDHFFDVDLICPNQSEASALLGHTVASIEQAKTASQELIQRGAKNSIITMGNQGAVLCDGNTVEVIPPYPIDAVDSTAAGDAFAGALAVFWSEQNTLQQATRFACAAGALAASRPGAQPGMPTRQEVEQLMKQ